MKLEGKNWSEFDRHLLELFEKGISLASIKEAVDSAWNIHKERLANDMGLRE